jgi:hypothetical protein
MLPNKRFQKIASKKKKKKKKKNRNRGPLFTFEKKKTRTTEKKKNFFFFFTAQAPQAPQEQAPSTMSDRLSDSSKHLRHARAEQSDFLPGDDESWFKQPSLFGEPGQ